MTHIGRNVSWCNHLPVCKLKEEVCMKFVYVLKGKLLVTVLVSVALLAGVTAVFAATPAGPWDKTIKMQGKANSVPNRNCPCS
jgi:hypothetical protein